MSDPESIEPLAGSGQPPGYPVDPSGVDTPDDTVEGGKKRRRRDRPPRPFWIEVPLLVAVALVVAVVVKTFLVQAFFIPSASMMDTLLINDRVMVNKLSYRWGEPRPGQLIVFDDPRALSKEGESFPAAVLRNIGEALGLATPDTALIKRIVAVGGQTLQIRDNRLFIDGEPVDESYLTRAVSMPDFGPITIPDGFVFVMGDNRNQSEDSRSSRLCPEAHESEGTRFCPISEEEIIGRAFIRVWPPSRWGGL
ncbi:MAG TPA: signal peptidase I [Acidimicrobiia bacterium]|nr:signal peptidase I [Acidimicrobiia bacterium]